MSTVTGVVSPAEPVKEGVALLLGVGTAASETAGAGVETVKLIVLLAPGASPNSLPCSAIAVYVPSCSGDDTFPELHDPPVPEASACATGSPVAELPS